MGDRGSRIIGAIWGAFMRIIIFEGAIEPLDFQLEEIRRILISKYDADVLVINSKNLVPEIDKLG